jgi:hypothetical protein
LLKEPVFIDLHNYAMLQNLSVADTAYIALGFAALGETETAKAMYNERILPHIQHIAPYYRVNTGATRAEILEATSVAALLASQLGMDERTGLHQYTVRNHTREFLVNMHRLSFIANEIENKHPEPASITYTLFGQEFTRNISHGRSYTLRIPAQNLGQFNLTSITGDVGAVSVHSIPLEDVSTVDADVTVTRQFFRAGSTQAATTFNEGDLVRVQITIDYSKKAINGSYLVTDFLPAGLVYTSNSARFGSMRHTSGQWRFATAEGQRVMFRDHNSLFDGVRTYYYYARVINPGTFTAEGTIVQNLSARDYLTMGANDVITIR